MSIDFIAATAPIRQTEIASDFASAVDLQRSVSGDSFGSLVTDGLAHLNEQLKTSQVDLQHLATGSVDNLHQVMIRMEEARLSFQLMLQVRNRLLESYQDVMRMQV